MKHAFQVLVLLCAATAPYLHAAAFPQRPAEMVRAGRTADDNAPILSFRDVATWRMETEHAVAKAEYATDRVLFGDGACKITYRGTDGDEHPAVRFFLPSPVELPADTDTISLWVWGNNFYGRPAGTPSVTVHGIFVNGKGERVTYELAHVLSARWSKYHVRFGAWLKSRLVPPTRLVGLMVRNGRNTEDRFIYLDSLCAYRETFRPLTFEPRAKRGVQLFRNAPQGVNVGEGVLPFPNTPRTVLPPERKPNPALEYRIPDDASNWDALAFRWRGGEWIPLAKGGGIFPAAARDAKASFFRDGDSLVCDIERPEPGVEEVRFGAIAAPDAAAVPLPFWNYREKGWTNRPCVVSMKLGGEPVFVSATPDWTQSNASELFAGRSSPGLAAANGGVRYRTKTDGRRNGCFERFVWTVSDEFAAVLPTIPNPPSPWKNITGTHLWHALEFKDPPHCRDFWHGTVRRGMKKVFASDYGTFWGDNSDKAIRYAEGEGYMPLYAADDKGGDEGFRQYVRYLTGLGIVYGPYNDFTDLRPTCRYWSPDNASRNQDGSLQAAWPGCYSPKPVWAVGVCERLAPQLKEKFGFNGAYCDVHTCVTPWSRTDYDARVPGAGTFAQTYYAYGEILLLQRKAWNGPVYSEGGMHWMYAGLSDGNYGQDQEYDLPRNPWLVDFDLMRIHPLSCDFGMGHNLDMFYVHGPYPEIPAGQTIDRFLVATAAFGHPGYLVINWTNAARSYYMIQSLASRYTRANAVDIRYADADGRLHPTSAAVSNGAYRRSQVVVTYDDGTVVVANGAMNAPMDVAVAGRHVVLPPNGFWGRSGDGKAESFLGEIDGHRAEWAVGDGYRYVNGRGRFTRFPDGTGADGIVVRLDEGNGTEEVIPTKAERVELPYEAESVLPLGYRGEPMRKPAEFTAGEGRTLLSAPAQGVYSWRVKRRTATAWRPKERWRGFNIVTRIYKDANPFREDDFRLIRHLGFNFARVTLNYRHWIKDGDWNAIDDAKLAEVDRAVEYGRRHGVHVQLCFHRAPGWCVASWPVEKANLFRSEEALRACEKHWRHFAERYRDVPPEVLSFNLMNEPGSCTEEQYANVAKRLVAAIREVSPDRFVVSDGLGGARRPCAALFGIPGVGQATRGYQPTDVSLYKASWGALTAPPPEWPYSPEAPIGNFMGPNKRLAYGDHPLVLEDLPPGTLEFRFGRINGNVAFEVVADGRRVAEWPLSPKAADPEWSDYLVNERWKIPGADFKGARNVAFTNGVKRIEVRLAKGDWACLRKVAFRPSGSQSEAMFPLYVEFGSHVNFVQRYDAASGRFRAVPDAADAGYVRRYADDGREYLYRHIFRYWDDALAKGEFGMIGEFAVWNRTPHPVALALMEDYLRLARERNMGWALWEFRGGHGLCNSGRDDVEYEKIPGFPGYTLDRKMYELLKRY